MARKPKDITIYAVSTQSTRQALINHYYSLEDDVLCSTVDIEDADDRIEQDDDIECWKQDIECAQLDIDRRLKEHKENLADLTASRDKDKKAMAEIKDLLGGVLVDVVVAE